MSLSDFDEDFQLKTIALVTRDQNFCERTDGLLSPDFFDKETDRYILNQVHNHYKKYNTNPSVTALIHNLKEDYKNSLIRKDLYPDIADTIRSIYKADISDREYIIDRVSDFVRKQATINAIAESADIIERGEDVAKILPLMQKAIDVGTTDLSRAYDFAESLEQRFEIRRARLAGEISFNSVSTGYKKFDDTLYRRGWGKGELSLYMAPAKAGKSIALLDHAIKAVEKGHNVLFVSLEVSTEIQADRMDSNISNVKMDDLLVKMDAVRDKLLLWRDRYKNHLKIHEYPSGSYRVSDLRRLIKKYQAIGVQFDLVVVDYADIMLSESSSTEGVDKSKQVFIDLRALAQQENIALLTATQTNREGAKADVIESIHVAEDFNKIRIADLVISINANEIEKEAGEARLHYAASRNQSSVTITVKRDLSCMKHIKDILEIR